MADIPFTQYLLPDGRKTQIAFPAEDLRDGVAGKAQKLLEAGYCFEAEVLTTGICSFTCENDERLLSIQLSRNGPDVIVAINQLIENAYSALIAGEGEEKE